MWLTRAATARPPGIWTLSHGNVTSLGDETPRSHPSPGMRALRSRSGIIRIKEGGWKWRDLRMPHRDFHLSETTLTGFLQVSKWFFGRRSSSPHASPPPCRWMQQDGAGTAGQIVLQAADHQPGTRHEACHGVGLAVAELEQDGPAGGGQR